MHIGCAGSPALACPLPLFGKRKLIEDFPLAYIHFTLAQCNRNFGGVTWLNIWKVEDYQLFALSCFGTSTASQMS